MSKQKVVHLRVYKSDGISNDISYNGQGKVLNENHLIKTTYQTLEWKNLLKNISLFYIKVEVEKAFIKEDNGYEEISNLKDIKESVEIALNPKKEISLTEDQKRIKALEAKLEAFMSGDNNIKNIDVDDAEIVDDLALARQEYQDHFNKKGHHSWSAKVIREKIQEDNNK